MVAFCPLPEVNQGQCSRSHIRVPAKPKQPKQGEHDEQTIHSPELLLPVRDRGGSFALPRPEQYNDPGTLVSDHPYQVGGVPIEYTNVSDDDDDSVVARNERRYDVVGSYMDVASAHAGDSNGTRVSTPNCNLGNRK